MKTWECEECGSEIQSAVKPKRPCKCGARGKWKELNPHMVVKTRGTPTTMRDAIRFGFDDCFRIENIFDEDVKKVETHVRDFLAQKFGAAMLLAEGNEINVLQSLWAKVTSKGV